MTEPTPLGALFDWDGVVVDSHDQHLRSWQLTAEELGSPIPEGFFKQTFGMRNEQILPMLGWAEAGDTQKIRALADRKEVLYRELVRQDGLDPLPGVRALLEALREAGIPRVIGSSTPRANIDLVLDVIGLTGLFDDVVASADVERGKPDGQVFELCAARIARQPARCVVFEDAHVGIEAARAAGCKVIAVTTTHPAASFTDADLVVASLAEVDLAAVRGLFGA